MVVVEPAGRHAPAGFCRQARLGADIAERAITIVVVQLIVTVAEHQQVDVAIAVVVRRRGAAGKVLAGYAGLFGRVGERPIVIIAVELVGEFSAQVAAAIAADVLLPPSADQVDVQPAIAVEVEKHGPGAGPLDNVLEFDVAVTVLAVEARRVGDVGEGG